MSDTKKDTCPSYYRVSTGAEFWEFYREIVEPHVCDALCSAAQHALQSACEYVFRNGRKPNEHTGENWNKVANLLHRVHLISSTTRESEKDAANAISTAIGLTVVERAFTEASRK